MAESKEPFPSTLPTSTENNKTHSSSSPTSHLFWQTQPVTQFADASNPALPDGPIFPRNPTFSIKLNPHTLPPHFEWTFLDLENDDHFTKLHRFIAANYAMDQRSLNFSYSPAFLRWLLLPPNHIKSLHVAVRIKNTNKLVGFIAGLPSTLRITNVTFPVTVANLLCVHRKLRSKKLTPALVRELVRRSNLEDIWQGIYATEIQLTLPLCSIEWLERVLNPEKLVELGYLETSEMSNLPPGPETIGFRKMKPQDAAAVSDLLQNYLKLSVSLEVDEHFVEHFIVPKKGVVASFVVENPETFAITDFCSFAITEMKIKKDHKYSKIKCGVLFYYAAFKTPVLKLMKDLMVMARRKGCDLIRAQGVMGNDSFLDKLMFRATHEEKKKINYYLYNYRIKRELIPHVFGLIVL